MQGIPRSRFAGRRRASDGCERVAVRDPWSPMRRVRPADVSFPPWTLRASRERFFLNKVHFEGNLRGGSNAFVPMRTNPPADRHRSSGADGVDSTRVKSAVGIAEGTRTAKALRRTSWRSPKPCTLSSASRTFGPTSGRSGPRSRRFVPPSFRGDGGADALHIGPEYLSRRREG